MKRILIISPMPPLIGGVAISSGRLFDNLKVDGYDVDSYNIKPEGKFYATSIGIIFRFFLIPFYILFHEKYDIIHCHVAGTYRKLYISLAKPLFFKGAKLIFTLHGDVRPLLDGLTVFAMCKADRLICVQKGDSAVLPNKLNDRSVDIPAFIMPAKVTEESVPTDILNFVKNKKYPLILFYGGVVFNEQYNDLYGINDVVDMYMSLRAKHIIVQMLMLVSFKNNADEVYLNKVKDRLRGDKNILLVVNGGVDMLPLFKYADLYVRPTKTDGDSLAVREALYMRCPVVASDKAVRPEGVAVYTSSKNFLDLSEKYIMGKVEVSEQGKNFYNQIKEVYGTC